jgi:glutathione S-transferase
MYILRKYPQGKAFAMNIDPWNIFTASFGGIGKPCTAFVTLLDMVLYFLVTLNVGRARMKYKIVAPETEGPPEFKQVFRVQQNTLEQLMLHLPLLWIAAFAMSDVFAAAFGAIWTLGRVLYARGYYTKPKRRHKGFMIAMAINAVLGLGALVGTIAAF